MQMYRTMQLWHWISAAVCFAALILFTVTGITLNHASAISSTPEVRSGDATAPAPVMAVVAAGVTEEGVPAPVLTTALYSRFASRNMDDFANRLLSAMRKQFGGHDEKAG